MIPPSYPRPDGITYPQGTTESLPRNPIGWVLLLILFGISIFVALTRRAAPEDSGSRLLSIERGIRSDAVFRKYPALGTPPDSLTELRTRATKEKGVEAGFLVALLDRERGEKPRAGDLAALAKGDAAAKARGRLLAFEGKDPKALERVLSPVADRRFVDRLAKAQARERAGVKPEEARKTLVDPTIPFRAGGMLLGFLGAIALSLLAWITFLVSRAQGAFPPLGAPPLPMTPGEADRFALRAAMLFGGFLLGSNVLGLLLRGFGGGAAMIGQVVFFTAVAFYALRLPRDPLVPQLSAQGIGIDASGANSGLGSKALWGMGAAFANIPIILIVTVVSSQLLKGVPAQATQRPSSFHRIRRSPRSSSRSSSPRCARRSGRRRCSAAFSSPALSGRG